MAYKTEGIEPEQQIRVENALKQFHRTGNLSNFVHEMEDILIDGKED
jgi:hypothetical protein